MILLFCKTTAVEKLLVFFFCDDNVNVSTFAKVECIQNTRADDDSIVGVQTVAIKLNFDIVFHLNVA